MGRLPHELSRLFAAESPAPSTAGDAGDVGAALVGAQGQVRALVLELARPADWSVLAAVWHGVQADLGLSAPAIAVNGRDGLQLWFSLAAPVGMGQAQAFLQGLCGRYLGGVPASRLGLYPRPDPQRPGAAPQHAAGVPAPVPGADAWSAFVAQDLAPLFVDTPWLDMPPGDDGQASLLSRLTSVTPAQWTAALDHLAPAPAPATSPAPNPAPTPAQAAHGPAGEQGPAARHPGPGAVPRPSQSGHAEAAHFLLSVLRDPLAPLAMRIEAAKALLPWPAEGSPEPQAPDPPDPPARSDGPEPAGAARPPETGTDAGR